MEPKERPQIAVGVMQKRGSWPTGEDRSTKREGKKRCCEEEGRGKV